MNWSRLERAVRRVEQAVRELGPEDPEAEKVLLEAADAFSEADRALLEVLTAKRAQGVPPTCEELATLDRLWDDVWDRAAALARERGIDGERLREAEWNRGERRRALPRREIEENFDRLVGAVEALAYGTWGPEASSLT